MADIVTFRQALERCGISQASARVAITDQGYTNIEEFAELSEKDIVDLIVKVINRLPAPAEDVAPPRVPFASTKKLKAFRNWKWERAWCGLGFAHGDFTDQELTRMIQRMDFLAQQKMNELDSPPLPEKFSTFGTKWRLFKEAIHGHLAVKRGCIDVPLIYVLRDHQVVTDAMRDADYGDSDEYLINVVSLTTDAFKQDNARVWEIVRPLLYGTPAWDYVKTYDRTKNGRMALRVLERRGEGEAALDARRTKAETTL